MHEPRALLEQGLAELDLPPDRHTLESLLELGRLLESWAQRMNLTGHRTLEAIIRRLLLDAAALSSQIPEESSLADLGSGAGFPGFPLAILRPECRVTLIESREKRHHFQRHVVRELGLANVEPRLGRAEQLEPAAHRAVIAQAAARPERALRWMLPWAGPGALLLLPGSENLPKLPEIEGISFEGVETYRVPCGGPRRTLWKGRATVGSGRETPACGN